MVGKCRPEWGLDDLIHGRADSATALGLHLALDLIVASVLIIRALHRWARRHDDHQRWILAVFLLVVLATTVVIGLREVLFRHSETRALLSLRTMILRRNRDEPFQMLAVVSPSLSGPVYDKTWPGQRSPVARWTTPVHPKNSFA